MNAQVTILVMCRKASIIDLEHTVLFLEFKILTTPESYLYITKHPQLNFKVPAA